MNTATKLFKKYDVRMALYEWETSKISIEFMLWITKSFLKIEHPRKLA